MPDFLSLSHCGNIHDENQDYVVTRSPSGNCSLSLIAVADGISGCPLGKSVARWVTEFHLAKDDMLVTSPGEVQQQIHCYLASLQQLFRDEFSDLPEMFFSGTCLSVAVHFDGEIHCYWVGDSPIYETRRSTDGYSTRLVSSPDSLGTNGVTDWFGGTSPFVLKHERVEPDASIITITSDGAIHDAQMLDAALDKHGFSDCFVEEVCREALKNPRADDVSIAAMKLNSA